MRRLFSFVLFGFWLAWYCFWYFCLVFLVRASERAIERASERTNDQTSAGCVSHCPLVLVLVLVQWMRCNSIRCLYRGESATGICEIDGLCGWGPWSLGTLLMLPLMHTHGGTAIDRYQWQRQFVYVAIYAYAHILILYLRSFYVSVLISFSFLFLVFVWWFCGGMCEFFFLTFIWKKKKKKIFMSELCSNNKYTYSKHLGNI